MTSKGDEANRNMAKLEFEVAGMHCAACVARIENAIANVAGVDQAAVNLALNNAVARLSNDRFSRDERSAVARDVVAAIESIGYRASLTGRSKADLAESLSTVDHSNAESNVESAGVVNPFEARRLREVEENRRRIRRLLAVSALAAPVFVIGMSHGLVEYFQTRTAGWIQLALTLGVMLLAIPEVYRPALQAIRRGIAEMNVLVGVSSIASFLFSTATLLDPVPSVSTTSAGGHLSVERDHTAHDLFFESTAVVLWFVLIGRYVEARLRRLTAESALALAEALPQAATTIIPSDRPPAGGAAWGEREVVKPVDRIAIGDVVLIRPGERVPVDGIVVAGASAVDESTMTGESLPVEKVVDSKVVAGSLNTTGALRVRAESPGAESAYRKILDVVETTLSDKPPIQKTVDRVAAVFTPIVIAIALTAGAGWLMFGPPARRFELAIRALTSTLTVACPCAMGLATPTALIAGVGRGARIGALIRGAEGFEKAATVDRIYFDKTGTLTRGRPTVDRVEFADGFDRRRLLESAAAIESPSEHPLARAVVEKARDESIAIPEVDDFDSTPGFGARGIAAGARVLVGNQVYLTKSGVAEGDVASFDDRARSLGADGRTVVYVAIDGRIAGLISFVDPIRSEAATVVEELKRRGIETVMLTGDRKGAAERVAEILRLDEVIAEVGPLGKRRTIESAKSTGKTVMMIGDGVNDAPALAVADLSASMGSGSWAAKEAADVTVIRDDLRVVVDALDLARDVRRTIRWNLFWAFVYNAAAIPIAAGALYPMTGRMLSPSIAGAAMAASSVSVVVNGLLLARRGVSRSIPIQQAL